MTPKMDITSKMYFRGIGLLFYALQAMQIIITVVVFVLVTEGKIDPGSFGKDTTMIGIAIGIASMALFVNTQLFRQRIAGLGEKPLEQKLRSYRSALILRWGILEFASLAAVVLFFISKDVSLIFIPVLMVGFAFTTKPTREKFKKDVPLDFKEEVLMDDEKAVLYQSAITTID